MKTTTTAAAQVISADRVKGTDVYNHSGDHLGEIDDTMIDKVSGEVRYAIMSFGGFLGIGEKYHPLPWKILKYDKSQDGYVVSLTKGQLEKAPYYSHDDVTTDDLKWREKVYSYYDTPAYWV